MRTWFEVFYEIGDRDYMGNPRFNYEYSMNVLATDEDEARDLVTDFKTGCFYLEDDLTEITSVIEVMSEEDMTEEQISTVESDMY